MAGRHHAEATGLQIEFRRTDYTGQWVNNNHQRSLKTLPALGRVHSHPASQPRRKREVDRAVHGPVRSRHTDVGESERSNLTVHSHSAVTSKSTPHNGHDNFGDVRILFERRPTRRGWHGHADDGP